MSFLWHLLLENTHVTAFIISFRFRSPKGHGYLRDYQRHVVNYVHSYLKTVESHFIWECVFSHRALADVKVLGYLLLTLGNFQKYPTHQGCWYLNICALCRPLSYDSLPCKAQSIFPVKLSGNTIWVSKPPTGKIHHGKIAGPLTLLTFVFQFLFYFSTYNMFFLCWKFTCTFKNILLTLSAVCCW